jgi:hypothetical protein
VEIPIREEQKDFGKSENKKESMDSFSFYG